MRTHWRLALAIFCSVGVVSFPFTGDTVGDKIGGTIIYLVAAIITWSLHARHAGWRRTGATVSATGSGQRTEPGRRSEGGRPARPGRRR